MRYPKFLEKGDFIGCTAPSEGIVKPINIQRLDNAIKNIEKLGYKYTETQNVRCNEYGRSSSAEDRAKQFMDLWRNEKVPTIISAEGGDFLCEMLDKINWEELKKMPPKWFQGYSNNTELVFLLTTLADTACIYGDMIKTYGMRNLHPTLTNSLKIMSGEELIQHSFGMHETVDWSERTDPFEEYKLVNKTEWKNLNGEKTIKFKGRAIGGCFDDIINIIGTKYDKVKDFIKKYANDGILWFLEIFEMPTAIIYTHLWQLKNAGYFENCKGIIFGRPLMVREDYGISYEKTLKDFFSKLDIPVIYDADIGHVSPQIPILSGGILEVECSNGKGMIQNYFS